MSKQVESIRQLPKEKARFSVEDNHPAKRFKTEMGKNETTEPKPKAVGDHAKYKQHDLRSHIYEIPDTWVGSTEKTAVETYVFDDEKKRMVKKVITYVPAFYKIFDEIIVNALDHVARLKYEKKDDVKPVKNVKVNLDRETGEISVYNDGNGIDIVMHPEYNMYVPSLVFGQLLTSTNYDQNEEKLWSGRNGIGAKATAIFSKTFTVETVDHYQKKVFKQTWSDNMKVVGKPSVKASTKTPYTHVVFNPDYERFGLKGLDDDTFNLFRKRVYDACACTDAAVNVFFNGQKLEYKTFEKYVDLYLGPKEERPRVYNICNERWEIVVAASENGFEQVSFVNGINTLRGGRHVDHITNQVIKGLVEMIQSKKKKDVKTGHLKENIMIFVKSQIVNPSFDSQTKETLTTTVAKFGSKCELDDTVITKIFKTTGIVEKAVSLTDFHEQKGLKKTDGKKQNRIIVPKLEDANKAGTKESDKCTLLLVEGDSAKTMAMSGLSEIGRDYYGIFPLKGKLMNVKDAAVKKITDNDELSNLKKILGLESGKVYTDISSLRYGRVMLLTDSDVDGIHIRGLLINFFQTLWPSLYERKYFLTAMLTPIIRATQKGGAGAVTGAGAGAHKLFYNLPDFEKWQKLADTKKGGWKIKYLKGLGTSEKQEAKEYFRDMKMSFYMHNGKASDESVDMAFNKKRADDRKKWLESYDRDRVIVVGEKNNEVKYEDFINNDLIHFSQADLERSIASVCDGLKVSQRKILFACFKRKLYTNQIKVAQLAGYVSEVSGYHHGEASLQQAIINLAQNFVGANNVPLLKPCGQFGSRVLMGSDAASPRYIFTVLTRMARKLFREEDLPVLTYMMDDDGNPIEPEYYVPVLPVGLMNGALGIGTGYSMNIPSFNPKDIIKVGLSFCDVLEKAGVAGGDSAVIGSVIDPVKTGTLMPWYIGFKGAIQHQKTTKGTDGFVSKGIFKWIDDVTIEVTELPVQMGIDDFKENLEAMLVSGTNVLKDFKSYCTDNFILFELKLYPGARDGLDVESEFKLSSSKNLGVNNMNLFNHNGAIRHYKNTDGIFKEWAKVRLEVYSKRKKNQLDKMEQQKVLLDARVRFIQMVVAGEMVVSNRPIAELESELSKKKFPKLTSAQVNGTTETVPTNAAAIHEIGDVGDTEVAEPEPDVSEIDLGDKIVERKGASYDYLVNMPIRKLTLEEKKRLEEQLKKLLIEIQALKGTPLYKIWRDEIKEFADQWHVYESEFMSELEKDTQQSMKKNKKK